MPLLPEYRQALRPVFWLLFALSASWIVIKLFAPAMDVSGSALYPPLHTLVESSAIIIAVMVFAISWVSRSNGKSHNLVLLGCVFLGVAMLDFLHMLSIPGMPDFLSPSEPGKAIYFWLAARFLSALGLLLIALLPWRPLESVWRSWLYLLGVMSVVLVIAWIGLFHLDVVPHIFIPGQGMTMVNLVSEYCIVILFCLAAVLFWRRMSEPQAYDVVNLFTAVCIMVLSELFLTLYAYLADLHLVGGQVYKVLSYLFVYKSIFVDNIKRPYQQLSAINTQLEQQIKERRQAEEALRASEERWNFALEGAGDGVYDWNILEGKVIYSKRWKQMLGYGEDEISHTFEFWASRIHPEDKSRVMEQLNKHLNDEAPYVAELRLRCKDDSWKWILDRGMVVTSSDEGAALRMIGTISDISERKRIEHVLRESNERLEARVLLRTHELNIAKKQAEAASAAKSQFLANMSHDIRTPMNSIIGMSTLALRTALNEQQHDYIKKIHESAQNLLGLINDILDISRIEAGKLQIEALDFNLGKVMNHVHSQLSHAAERKGLTLTMELAPELMLPLRGDPLRLGQILNNLIGNAVKFTQTGCVSVRASMRASEGERVGIRFEIQDSGVGIPPASVPNLFKPFVQADASTTRKFGGSGLGLAICKQLINLMHGEIGFSSDSGQGSLFWFEVAFERGNADAVSLQDVQVTRPDFLTGLRILLVEDNLFNQQVASELLEQAGAVVSIANNGQEALDSLSQQEFDCVLMDVQMPVMDGFEATRRIRENAVWAALPVLAMTANARSEDRSNCLDVGMNDFIAKPLQPALMFSTLSKWLKLPESTNSPGSSAPLNKHGTEGAVIDLAHLDTMWNNNPDKVSKYARMFEQSIAQDMIEVAAALQRDDPVQLGKLGHRIKSSAETIGAHSFAALCHQLEKFRNGGNIQQAHSLVEQMQHLLPEVSRQINATLVARYGGGPG